MNTRTHAGAARLAATTALALALAWGLSACDRPGKAPAVETPAAEAAEPAPRAGPIFNEAFTEGFEATVGTSRLRFRTQPVGDIDLPTGRLVACDPLVTCDAPFEGRLPTGRFPLELAIASNGEDERVALARIVFAPGPVARWEMALVPGQDVRTLKKGEFFGYGVDSGTGGFADAQAMEAYKAQRIQQGEAFDQRVIAALEQTYRHTRSWHLYDTGRGMVALFSSGYGDGAYPTYRAYDADGRLVAVITDFLVVPWE